MEFEPAWHDVLEAEEREDFFLHAAAHQVVPAPPLPSLRLFLLGLNLHDVLKQFVLPNLCSRVTTGAARTA